MQVREEWKQTVSAKQGVLAVLGVIVLLGGMGIFSLHNGHLPPVPPAFYGASLAIVWALALWDWRRFGKRALPFWRVVYLLGFSAFFGGHLIATGIAAREWIINVGTLLMMAFIGVSIFGPRLRQRTPHDTVL